MSRPALAVPKPTNRLSFDDDLFLRSRTALGVPMQSQGVWRFDERLALEDVEALWAELARGPLARRVLRTWIPGARARWVRSSARAPLGVHAEPLAEHEVMPWLDRCAATTDLDPERGPIWRMDVAWTVDGGTVLSWQDSHVVCDGGIRTLALSAAVRRQRLPRLPVDDPAAQQVRWSDDVRDAWGQTVAAVRALAAGQRRKPAPVAGQRSADTPPPAPAPDDDEPVAAPTVVVESSAEEWHEAARAAGGTGNGLLAAVLVEVLLATGRARAGEPVRLSVPVSVRGEDDLRSNATRAVPVTVETTVRDGVGVVTDLAHIRERSKVAFTSLNDGSYVDPMASIEPLAQMLPDALVRRLAGSIASPLVIASNLGRTGPEMSAPTGVPARSLAFRVLAHGTTRGMLRRMRGGVSGWWTECGATCTLGVTSSDPDHVRDTDHLREIVASVYERWGLTPGFW
ncbi:MAG: hypothetical protein FWE71_10930 [Nocardioidaceae bacterium]|nr:hypothetical protein [Nocardioidaceae bacterium]MCL2611872.1 hypothetical protein [Nocardioidaceae bacterium]